MNLGSVREDDIVMVDKKGRRFLAMAGERIHEEGKKTRLKIRPIQKNITWFEASATEVVKHYKLMGRPR